MIDWLICAALLALVTASIRKLVTDRKSGKGGCCGHCAGCTMRCERYEERKEEETP